ncbi:beta-ketoacyl-[acyl-carrier-protein] synthase family protein [Lichenicoccus roseus]|uniref:Beta-ketoacyl-[acyl-carrier-protein] synthase family protein n=1 Tax=Lichenicoccus roseus TaxID=2683649 RepID=A0A5R9JBH9_9PROT|nr:beta-ketoacyl-[acyl-carrier-protein] synthase family protein [Lichenicoccus roseus]TLU74103.1 beta-ketoacyl-[acyl-carrier-protein] synthase family protein [Lichenicoccus roseus]
MTPLHLTATALASAVGAGSAATLDALRQERSSLAPCDFEEIAIGGQIGRVRGLEQVELPAGFGEYDCRNNRLAWLALQQDGFIEAVRGAIGRHGAGRIAVVLGTSTSGILSAETAYRARDPATGLLPDWFRYDGSYDLFSLSRFVADRLGVTGPAMTVSTACASSARACLDASHLIASGVVDAAVVGGADSLCGLTLRGFDSLDLISPERCRPFDAARRGISIGEAAGFALLEREPLREGGVALLGIGASTDGYHMSSPQPDGIGAEQAMRRALASATLDAADIHHVNLHGTGTRANDLMEARAVNRLFGSDVPCASTKGWTGHCMGSSGIVEALIASLCIENDLLPACHGLETRDPEIALDLERHNRTARIDRVMSNSFGFGGVNVSLVIGRPAR